MKGLFITVEGSEGSGKSSNLENIAHYLRSHQRLNGKELIVTREPGGTPLGEEVRSLLLQHRQMAMSSDAELLLMFAARAEHLHQVILPHINQGNWVLCDRFTDATYAYQGGGRKLGRKRIEILENWTQGDLRPDLTILLDVTVEIGLQRASKRGALDRFEQESLDFFKRVRTTYLEEAKLNPVRYRVINANQSLAQVTNDLHTTLDDFLNASESRRG